VYFKCFTFMTVQNIISFPQEMRNKHNRRPSFLSGFREQTLKPKPRILEFKFAISSKPAIRVSSVYLVCGNFEHPFMTSLKKLYNLFIFLIFTLSLFFNIYYLLPFYPTYISPTSPPPIPSPLSPPTLPAWLEPLTRCEKSNKRFPPCIPPTDPEENWAKSAWRLG